MRITTLIRYEWKTYIADRKALGIMVSAPFLLLLLFLYGLAPLIDQEGWVEKFDIALVNQDDSWETRTIIQHFESAEDVRKILTIHHLNETAAKQRLLTNQIAAMIVIPEGFSRDLELGKNTPVEVIGSPQRPLQAELVRILMQSGADMITAAQSGINTIYLYMQKANLPQEELRQIFTQSVMQFTLQSLARGEIFERKVISAYGSITGKEYYAVALSVIFLLGMALFGLRSGEGEVGEGKLVLQRLLALGIPYSQVLLARWISFSTLLMLPYSLYYLGMYLLFDDFFRQANHFSFVLISIWIIGSVSALFLFIFNLAMHMATVQLLGMLLIGLMSLLGGSILPSVYLPAWLEPFTYLSLNKWAADGLYAALYTDGEQVLWHSMLILGLSTLLLLALTNWLGKRRVGSCSL